jgi:glycosyltransferase involved in cell wall biosynthesis
MQIISIDARMINNSGIGVYLGNLITSLSDKYQLMLLGNYSEINKSVALVNAKVIECRSSIYSLKEQAELPLNIPESDLFISPHYNIPLLPVKAKKRLVVIHDVNHLAFYDKLSLSKKLYAKVMINRALRLSNCVMTVSEFSKSEIIKYTSQEPDKIKIVHFGINEEKIKENLLSEIVEGTKKELNLPDQFLLFVGNVKPHKNLISLLKAFEILLQKRGDYKLVIAGKKEGFITEDREVFNFIESNPLLKENILFTGYLENKKLFGIYKLASAFVFPSLYEGFGIPPLEAMACECPVIASNAASIPEVCGDSVLYINPYDPADIAEKIEIILGNKVLRDELISKGKTRLNKFSLTNFSTKLREVIEGII